MTVDLMFLHILLSRDSGRRSSAESTCGVFPFFWGAGQTTLTLHGEVAHSQNTAPFRRWHRTGIDARSEPKRQKQKHWVAWCVTASSTRWKKVELSWTLICSTSHPSHGDKCQRQFQTPGLRLELKATFIIGWCSVAHDEWPLWYHIHKRMHY